MSDSDVTGLHAVFQPEVSDINMSRFGTSGNAAILSQFNGAFVVLFQNITAYGISLGFHEHLDPDGVGKVITGAHGFGFGGTFCV